MVTGAPLQLHSLEWGILFFSRADVSQSPRLKSLLQSVFCLSSRVDVSPRGICSCLCGADIPVRALELPGS